MVSQKEVILLVFTLFTFIFLLAQTNAANLVYQKGYSFDLKIPCMYNGTYCSSTALCNLTTTYPNASLLINNQAMTYQTSFFNYTFPDSSLYPIGNYVNTMMCCQGVDCSFSTFNFAITPNGSEVSIAQGVLYLAILVISLFFFFLCFYWAIKIPFKHSRNSEGEIIGMSDLRYVKIILWFGSYLLFLWIVFLARIISFNFLFVESIDNFLYAIFMTLMSALLPIFVGFALFGLIAYVNDKKIQKALQRGLPIR